MSRKKKFADRKKKSTSVSIDPHLLEVFRDRFGTHSFSNWVEGQLLMLSSSIDFRKIDKIDGKIFDVAQGKNILSTDAVKTLLNKTLLQYEKVWEIKKFIENNDLNDEE